MIKSIDLKESNLFYQYYIFATPTPILGVNQYVVRARCQSEAYSIIELLDDTCSDLSSLTYLGISSFDESHLDNLCKDDPEVLFYK